MVDRAESGLKAKDVEFWYWKVYDVVVSNTDTITLDEFSTVAGYDLKEAVLNSKEDGRVITCTHAALNVVTCTDATASNTPCVLYAFGRKA